MGVERSRRLIRDSIFLQQTPIFLLAPVYMLLVSGATVLWSLFAKSLTAIVGETGGKLVDLIDARSVLSEPVE